MMMQKINIYFFIKNNRLWKHRQKFLLFYLPFFALLFWHCDSSKGIGSELLDDVSDTYLVDTSQILTSTMILDSLATSGASVVLVGKVNDTYTGKISTESYFQIGFNGEFVPDTEAVFDSLVLLLNYNAYSYGDTTQLQSIAVHQLTEEIELPDDQTYFYANQQFAYQSNPLATYTFRPRPRSAKVQRIKLPDALGNQFFSLAKEESEEFLDFFKGLALIPHINNSCVLGFGTSDANADDADSEGGLKIRLYYREDGEEKHYDFPLTNSNLQFNRIINDRSNTFFANLQTQRNSLSSNLTNRETLIQGGLGMFTKIEIPFLDGYLELGKKALVVYAELVVKPIRGTYKSDTPLLTLALYQINGKNEIVNSFDNLEGNQIAAQAVIDNEFQTNTYYTFDLTDYIINALETDKFEENTFVIGLAGGYNTNFSRAVLGGLNHPNSEIKLRVIVTEYF